MRNASELAFGPVRGKGQTFFPRGDPPRGEIVVAPRDHQHVFPYARGRPVQTRRVQGPRPSLWVPSGNRVGPAARITPSADPDARVHGPRPSLWVPPGENRVGTAARITPSPCPDAISARTTSPHCVGTLWGNPAGPAGPITPSPGPDATSARTTSPHCVGTLWGNPAGPAGPITPSPGPDATSARTTSLCGSHVGKSYWPAGLTRPNASLSPVIT
jgi:hypothetical protein